MYIEKILPGQFKLYKNFDVMMWLDNRRFEGKENLKEISKFIVMNDELEKDYDEFMLSFKDAIYIPERDIVHYFFKVASEKPVIMHKFGKVYFKIAPETLGKLYSWMKDIHDSEEHVN